jgi:hypothetical protein
MRPEPVPEADWGRSEKAPLTFRALAGILTGSEGLGVPSEYAPTGPRPGPLLR